MTEQFSREYISERTEMIREANHRVSHSISTVGLSAELMIRATRYLSSLRGVDVTVLEVETGEIIRHLVQAHLNTYMQGPTCVRGRGLALGANAWGDNSDIGAVLDIDSGQLYDARVPRARRLSTEPLPEIEWFRHWRGVLYAATTMKAY